MQTFPYHYCLTDDIAPFSTIRGGFALFNADVCQRVQPRSSSPTNGDSEVIWQLRPYPEGEVFSATQCFADNRWSLKSEQALVEGQSYETLEITTKITTPHTLRRPDQKKTGRCDSAAIGRGTHIMTIRGEVRVENLVAGDRLVTRDHSMQEIIWVGQSNLQPDVQSILFTKGSINNSRDMILCPNQLVVLKGAQALLRYGQREVLVAAHTFVNGDSIRRIKSPKTPFYQILLRNHEVIYAEAAAIESFLPSRQNMQAISAKDRQMIYQALPKLRDDPDSYGPLARWHVGETLH